MMKRAIFKRGLWLSVMMIFGQLSASGTIYYFSQKSGSDSYTGLSTQFPKLRLASIATLPLISGDSILFKAGDTWSQDPFILQKKQGVFIGMYDAGPLPELIVSGIPYPAILLSQCSNIRIHQIKVKRADQEGIIIDRCRDIQLLNCQVDTSLKNGIAVYGGGDHISIQQCKVQYARDNGIYFDGTLSNKISHCQVIKCEVLGTATNDGIVVHDDMQGNTAGSGFQFLYNRVENCAEQGFDLTSGDSIYLEGNVTKNNKQGSFVCGWSVSDVFIFRHRSQSDGNFSGQSAAIISGEANRIRIAYSRFEGPSNRFMDIRGKSKRIQLHHIAFAWSGAGSSILDIGEQADSIEIYNSLFYKYQDTTNQGGPRFIRFLRNDVKPDHIGFYLNHNQYQPLLGKAFYTAYGSGKTFDFLQFQDSFKQELQGKYLTLNLNHQDEPTVNSPFINQGKKLQYVFDFNLRPVDAQPDPGCFEYQWTNAILNHPSKAVLLFPNPCQNEMQIKNGAGKGEIYTLEGKKMMELQLSEDSIVSINELPQGLYIFRGEGWTKKFCVQRGGAFLE